MRLPVIERLRRENQALRIFVRRAMSEAGTQVLEARQLAWEQAAEIDRLRDALEQYGKHEINGCTANRRGFFGTSDQPCSCGLEDVARRKI